MTERFTITQDFEEHHRQIRDNGKIIMGCFLEPQAEPIVKLLNELHEEKTILEAQLRSANNEIDKLMAEINMLTDTCHDCCKEIREENKELKKQVDEMINIFNDSGLDYHISDELEEILND